MCCPRQLDQLRDERLTLLVPAIEMAIVYCRARRLAPAARGWIACAAMGIVITISSYIEASTHATASMLVGLAHVLSLTALVVALMASHDDPAPPRPGPLPRAFALRRRRKRV